MEVIRSNHSFSLELLPQINFEKVSVAYQLFHGNIYICVLFAASLYLTISPETQINNGSPNHC